MNPRRVVVGLAMLAVGMWAVPMLSDLTGIPSQLAFACLGCALAFGGGMLVHSGVVSCRRW